MIMELEEEEEGAPCGWPSSAFPVPAGGEYLQGWGETGSVETVQRDTLQTDS